MGSWQHLLKVSFDRLNTKSVRLCNAKLDKKTKGSSGAGRGQEGKREIST